ncbi:MAG: hypothetical protein KAJ37_14070 [Candidatus Krumholzibacteria bacterium]|nr:hypothetical protein [Candidatus Krumholzibacteria bacterium]
MIFPRNFVGIATLLAVLVVLVPAATAGQGLEAAAESVSEGHETAEHEFHRNHFGGFLGASTHSDNDDTGFTLGLEYARQFTPRWAVVAYTELASGDLERDIILAVGAIFYPMRRIGLVVAPGVEFASKDVEHHGEVEKEDETEFLLRLGAGYGFPVGQASLGPVVFADWAGNRWTLVYGIGMVTGF